MKLSEHFSLEEMIKTKTGMSNIPDDKAVANLKNICQNWLEDLRYSYGALYGEGKETPIIITSGYRSAAVNKAAGGVATSNHLTGCAVDIRACGPEQALRYMNILLDISDGTNRVFDELLLERKGFVYWIHFAVRPENNRRKINFILKN